MGLFFALLAYILVLACVANSFKNKNSIKNKKNIYLFFVMVVFIFLSACRSVHVGNDTLAYVQIFENVNALPWGMYSARFEVGYVLFNKCLGVITKNPQIVLCASSLIIFICYWRFIAKHSAIPWLSVLLMFTLGYFALAMSVIRMSMAIGCLLISYDFIKKRNFWLFLIMVILASLLHMTAIVFILAYPISRLQLNMKNLLIILAISVGVFLWFDEILKIALSIFPNYEYYIAGKYLDGEVRIASVVYLLGTIAIIWMGTWTKRNWGEGVDEKLDNKELKQLGGKNCKAVDYDDNRLMLNILLFGAIMYFLSIQFNLLDRVGMYFQVFAIAYLPNAISRMKEKKTMGTWVLVIVIVFALYATSIQLLRPDWNRIYPYTFFWQ